MRVITCAGYYATGSGAVGDFLREFENCASLGTYEVRFLQDPNGISDLEYNLIDNNHRHNTSQAIKHYIKYVKYLNGNCLMKRYRRFWGNEFYKISMEYVHRITKLETKTWWHYDQLEKGRIFNFLDLIYGYLTAKFRAEGRMSLLKGRENAYYTDISKEQFYRYTQDYIERLMEKANISNADNLLVEQMIPPSNTRRYINYFKDVKIIIVDRDPRDLYIAANKVYQEGIIPSKNVEEFCQWYRITRSHRKTEEQDKRHVLFVRFEDMIYHYEETTKKIMDFMGFTKEQHLKCGEYFDPYKSIKGTQLIKRYPEFQKDIQFIEKELEEYLYPYEEGKI